MSNSRAGLVYGLHAIASILGAAGGATYDRQRGFAATVPVRNGAGDYTATVSDAIDATPAQHVCIVSTANGASAMIDAVIASANTVEIRTFTGANAAADMRFTIAIMDMGVT